MYSPIAGPNAAIRYDCTISIIDGSERIRFVYKSDTTGRQLLQHVCNLLGLDDNYQRWGFTFRDLAGRKRWIRMEELIRPRVRHLGQTVLNFQLHFYPPKPYKIFDDVVRRMLLRQLRCDLKSSLLVQNANDAAMLVALTLQCSYGDFNPSLHSGNYVRLHVLRNQTIPVEVRAMEIHKENLAGLNRVQAEDLLLRMVSTLNSYGKDFYAVKDDRATELWVGFDAQGVVVNLNTMEVSNVRWESVEKIEQTENKLCFHMRNGEIINLSCLSSEECNYLCDRAIEQQVLHSVTADLPHLEDSLDVDEAGPHLTENSGQAARGSWPLFDPRLCAVIIIIFSVVIYWSVMRTPLLRPKHVERKGLLQFVYQRLFDRPYYRRK